MPHIYYFITRKARRTKIKGLTPALTPAPHRPLLEYTKIIGLTPAPGPVELEKLGLEADFDFVESAGLRIMCGIGVAVLRVVNHRPQRQKAIG
jgi:hypothetical protein